MFSSIARSIKSIAKGPRAVLAENIARALSEHFVLDPADIESSLLTDARIVLKNTKLRPRRYRSDNVPQTVVSVNGIVEEVEFSWRWSFSGGSSATANSTTGSSSGSGVVQDVVLAIRGIKTHIVLDGWDTLDKEEQALVENFESASVDGNEEQHAFNDGTSLKEKEGFVQKYVKQIVDNLTLKLDDFEFTLKIRNGPSMIVAGKDLELGTLSSAVGAEGNIGSSTILSQRISIGSFFVNTMDAKSGECSPLIEPFGYAASVIRHSGERFKGGILSGLQVLGLPECSEDDDRTDEGILFHIGISQIQVLSALGVMLVPSKSYSTESALSEEFEGKTAKVNGESSTFNLSLPALTIVLPPSGPENVHTKITLPRATVLYRADGQVFQIEGNEGIKDNGKSLVDFASGGKWSVDFVNKIFDLDKDGEGCKIFVSDKTLTRIYSSVTSLSSTNEIANLKDAWEGSEGVAGVTIESETSNTWSISTGNITVQLAGTGNHWIETNVTHLHMQFSGAVNELTEAKFGECTVKSSFDRAAAIVVPSFSRVSGMFRISDTIEAAVTSVDKALQIQDFLLSFFQSSEKSNEPFDTFPFPIEILAMKISASNPPATINIGCTSAIGSDIRCEEINCIVRDTISFSMKRLLGNMISRSLSIDCVESLELPGTAALSKQLLNTNLNFEREVLHVNIPTTLHATMLLKNTPGKMSSTQQNRISIPFQIRVSVPKATLKTLRIEDKSCIQMEGITFDIAPATLPSQDLLSGEAQEGAKVSLGIENIEHEMFQAKKLQASLMLEDQSLETLHQVKLSINSTGVGAGYSSNEWSSLFIGQRPIDGVKQKVMKMPFAKVARTSISISYQGSVVDGNATVAIPDFEGNALTTSNDLSTHYVNAVIQRIPDLLTNVNILGTNVVDGAFANMGKLALGARNVSTAGVGSVIGTATSDGVKAAIASGKSARNVTQDDSYQFGDITRGIFSGIRHATKKGAQSRGSDGSDYVPGDFTVGTAKALGNYGENNSRKLASAGASGAAATVGFAVAGPLGLLAGSYIGGRMVGGGNGEQQQASQQHQYQREQEQQYRLNHPPERAFNHQQQQFTRTPQQGHQGIPNVNHQRQPQQQQFTRTPQQGQQGIPIVDASLQHPVEIPMVNALVISNEPIYAERITGGFSPHQTQYQRPNSRQTRVESWSNPGNQSTQFQLPQISQNQQHLHQQRNSQVHHLHSEQQHGKPYRFGDFSRGIVAKGKKADGRREDSGYKFGDFTRGLFK